MAYKMAIQNPTDETINKIDGFIKIQQSQTVSSIIKMLNNIPKEKNEERISNLRKICLYLIDKTGTAEIIRNKNKSTLTLITCKHNTNKQIIVIAELI